MDTRQANGPPSMSRILNEDCLQELFSRCDTHDLLKLRQTCKLFYQVLSESRVVWTRRLFADYQLKLGVVAQVPRNALYSFAKSVYNAPYERNVRFQAVLVNGGIDALNASYWADNLFRADRSPYCSDCSTNADCLALLLDGEVPREQQYKQVREYLRSRSRYAAALLSQVAPQPQSVDEFMEIVHRWSDPHLEHFFLSLVENLENEHPLGRLLLYDIPHYRTQAEIARLQAVRVYLQERPRVLLRGMLQLPGDLKTMFDASVIDKLGPDSEKRAVGVIDSVEVCRAGSLTCPVSSGVVFAGVFDRSRLKGLSPEETAKALRNASLDPMVVGFNDICTLAALQENVSCGALPPIVLEEESPAGISCQFATPREYLGSVVDGDDDASGKLIKWRPLFWFKFAPVAEAEAEQQENEGQEPQVMEDDDNNGGSVGGDQSTGTDEGANGFGGDDSVDEEQEEQLWNEGELEEAQQDQPMMNLNAFGVNEADEGIGEEEFMINRTRGRDTLRVSLKERCAATSILIKMIDQEDLMEELHDPHSWPNIDMAYVMIHGKRIDLPNGLSVQP